MFEQRSGSSSTAIECNIATTVGKALLASDNSEIWIIDTDVATHMVSSLDMLTKEYISMLDSPKHVYLLNGDSTKVTHVGSSALLVRSLVTNVFHISQFRYNFYL